VKFLGKKKVYELARELNIDNKKLIEIAQKLGIDVKSHLSGIDEAGVEKIKDSMKKDNTKKSNNEVKTTGQVIIRREVIVDDESKNVPKTKPSKSEIGATAHRTNNNFNIVYREKPTKPMTVSELFGLKPKKTNESKMADNAKTNSKDTKNTDKNGIANGTMNEKVSEKIGEKDKKNVVSEADTNKANNIEEQKNVNVKNNTISNNDELNNSNDSAKKVNTDEIKEKISRESVASKSGNENKSANSRSQNNREVYSSHNNYYGNNNYGNNKRNGFNRNNQNNGFNRNNNREDNRNFGKNNNSHRDSQGYNSRFNNNGFNGENGFRGNNKKSDNKFDNKKNQNGRRDFTRNSNNQIDESEFIEEKNQRDYSSKFIDKQKANRNFEEKKKSNKSRRFVEDFDEDKLRDLKQTDRLSNMFDNQDDGGMLDYYDLSTARGKKGKKKAKKEERNKQKIFELKEITIPEKISVKDLATELKKTSAEVLKQLINLGIMANLNQDLDFDTAYLVADSFGVTAKKKEEVKDEDILFDDSEDKEEDLEPRPPVVVVMGHVDHGKTSLLDAIRKTNVIGGEAGGITQHIGAYKVTINGREITFLDTPGHEAFTSMRARGAQITDIAILVVAADDGVMPQTIEAINHAKAAEIPIIVAVNKIDLPNANVERVKQELMKYELVPEEWGGNTIFVPISAKNNVNIDNLLEMVLLEADMLNLRANPNKQSKGTVIEARLDKAKGPIASVLVQRGTLNVGDTVIVGTSIGNIRTMKNDKGKNVKAAGPSTPVEITGLKAVPEAGDIFYEVKNEKVAKHLIEKRKLAEREKAIANTDVVTLDNLFEKMENEKLKVFNVIVKTDVQGTAEAMKTSLEKLSNDEVKVKVLHSSAGGVSESDVELAKAANAMIIAFNVRPVGNARNLAEKEGVEINQYSVIYQALEDVENAMKGMLAPKFKEINIGNAEVRQVFKVSNVGTIAGCYVTDGKVARNAGVRIIRDGVVIHDGKLISLKRFKDDAKEVSKGFECGMQIEDFDDIKEGDTIEAYIQEQINN
jgi:translation initiation factor IF-2